MLAALTKLHCSCRENIIFQIPVKDWAAQQNGRSQHYSSKTETYKCSYRYLEICNALRKWWGLMLTISRGSNSHHKPILGTSTVLMYNSHHVNLLAQFPMVRLTCSKRMFKYFKYILNTRWAFHFFFFATRRELPNAAVATVGFVQRERYLETKTCSPTAACIRDF